MVVTQERIPCLKMQPHCPMIDPDLSIMMSLTEGSIKALAQYATSSVRGSACALVTINLEGRGFLSFTDTCWWLQLHKQYAW